MSPLARTTIFLCGAVCFAVVLLWGLMSMPAAGGYRGPYGDLINGAVVAERHVTDAVTAVNFDYRGVDTLGEEFILFASVLGVVVLLRRQPDEVDIAKTWTADHAPDRYVPPPSDGVRATCSAFVGPLVVFGLYIIVHGQLTPGGGFQGGVVAATVPLLIFLSADSEKFRRIAPHGLVEASEAAGAAGYVLVGLFGLIAGARFLSDIIPLGQTGSVFSGGTIPLISLTTGLEVCGGFVLLMSVFIIEALERRQRGAS